MIRTFDGGTKLKTVLDSTPGALEYIVSINPHDFTRLENPFMRKYMSSRITLRRVAAMAKVSENKFVNHLNQLAGSDAPALDENETPSDVPQPPQERPAWLVSGSPSRVVDVMEIDNNSGDPMPPIMTASRRLQPGEFALLKHRWEPQPLYDIWHKTGLKWFTEQVQPMEWHIYIYRPPDVAPWKKEDSVVVMLDHLNPDEIAPRCRAVYHQLASGESLEIRARSKVLIQQARDALAEHKGTYDVDDLPGENGRYGIIITHR